MEIQYNGKRCVKNAAMRVRRHLMPTACRATAEPANRTVPSGTAPINWAIADRLRRPRIGWIDFRRKDGHAENEFFLR